MRNRSLLLPLLALGLLVAACGEDDTGGGAAGTDPQAEPVNYSDRGPYAVGEIELHIDEDHTVAVFYPVDREAVADDAEPYTYAGEDIFGPEIVQLLPGALAGELAPLDTWRNLPASEDGPFPVVLHSHGAAGNLRFAGSHNSHVASWGYVVASVDHPERGVVAALEGALSGRGGARGPGDDERDSDSNLDTEQLLSGLDLLVEESGDGGSVLAGAVDEDQVAAEGHSAGGGASGGAAYEDDRIDLWIGQAPGSPIDRSDRDETPPPDVPSLLIAAEGDEVVPLDEVEAMYEWLEPPKRLAVIADSGHAVFVDPCQPIQQEGGLSEFVETFGIDPDEIGLLQLGEDGCLPEDTPAEAVWSFIDHVTVAELQSVFDRDRAAAEASLTEDFLEETFPERFGRIESETG